MHEWHISQRWKDDSRQLVSTKQGADGTVEITLPYSTLTDKFVRVYVSYKAGSYALQDGADLLTDEYETGTEADVSGPYLQAKQLLAKGEFSGIYDAGGIICMNATEEMLTSALCDMAQFIQLSVNLAYLSV